VQSAKFHQRRGRAKVRPMVAAVLAIIGAVTATAVAQPDPRQMSGLPLPDPQLRDGTITVRVIRGQLTNNVPNHPVELHQGDSVSTSVTDAEGRATFLTLASGTQVYAVTELDGERIESQRFPLPGRGGIRVMLVGAAGDASIPAMPVQSGRVRFGGDSRILVEMGEETVEVYYLFDVINERTAPVEPPEPIVFDMPPGAVSVTILPDSSPRTASEGPRATLSGPFQSGTTPLRVAYILPYSGDRLTISQRVPADLEAFLVMVEKWGAMDVASSLIARRTEDVFGESSYIFGAGPLVAGGETFTFELSGLPHHSRLPTTVAVGLALTILGVGVWGALTPVDTRADTDRRLSLEGNKATLFADLVKIEKQHRAGKIGKTKYGTRRTGLVVALERVYGELDAEPAPVT
jgi:hypothetical protein